MRWKLRACRENVFGIRGEISRDVLVIVGKKIERERERVRKDGKEKVGADGCRIEGDEGDRGNLVACAVVPVVSWLLFYLRPQAASDLYTRNNLCGK